VRTIDEVVADIRSLLSSPGGVDREAGARVLQEYLEVVGPAIALLNRCSSWAARGLYVEAVSVADDFPRLIEVGERLLQDGLSEAVAGTLRDLAPRGVSIPVVDPGWVDALERAAAEVERLDTWLERLQSMALGRGPLLDRVRTVRHLIAQDPASPIWLAELGRLEDAGLAELRAAMLDAQQRGDMEGVQRSASEILRDQWTRAVPDGLRKEARAVMESMQARHALSRYTELVSPIREAHGAADEDALDRLELEWVRIQQTTGAMPPADIESSIEPAFRSLAQSRQRRERDREFQAQVGLLDTILETRGSETEIGSQMGIVRAFDRELPPGLEQRVQAVLDQIQSARHRRLLLRIAAVIAVVALVGAMVWWRIDRMDAQERARQIAAEVDRKLAVYELGEAEALVASSGALAEEADLIAAASRISERRPTWQADRDECRGLLGEAKQAASSPIPPATRKDLEARADRVRDRLRPSELQELEAVMASVKGRAQEYMDTLKASYNAAFFAWLPEAKSVKSLDESRSDGWRIDYLNQLVDRCVLVSSEGSAISGRYAELGQEGLTLLRSELDRLSAISTSAADRIGKIDRFHAQFSSLVLAADDPAVFLERYQSMIKDHTEAINGLGLLNALRDGMEWSQDSRELVTKWNSMVGALEGVRLTEQRSPLTRDQAESIGALLSARPDDAQSQIAMGIQKIAARIHVEGKPIGELLAGRLMDSGICDLKVIPLAKSGRLFRRVAEPDGPFNSGVLRSRNDVSSTDLGGVSPRPTRKPAKKGEQDQQTPTSQQVLQLATALKPLGLRGCRQRILDCIASIVADHSGSEGEEGAAFRLWVVVQLLQMWQDLLSVDPRLPVEAEISQVLTELRQSQHSEGMDFDWARPLLTPEQVGRAMKADAAALASMEKLGTLADLGRRRTDGAQLASIVGPLRRIEPAGAVGWDPIKGEAVAFQLGSGGPYLTWKLRGDSYQRRQYANRSELERSFRETHSGPIPGPVLVFTIKEQP
jgi:hypothetical protein